MLWDDRTSRPAAPSRLHSHDNSVTAGRQDMRVFVPISVGGWGLRELAVTAFLNAQGVPVQQAFLFSVCFGLVLIAASTPGALVLIFFSFDKARDNQASTS